MAIKSIGDEEDKFQIEINNGDLLALSDIIEKWNFKDKESALRFALAILTLTENGTLYKENSEGNKVALEPSEMLLKLTE